LRILRFFAANPFVLSAFAERRSSPSPGVIRMTSKQNRSRPERPQHSATDRKIRGRKIISDGQPHFSVFKSFCLFFSDHTPRTGPTEIERSRRSEAE
jgi:hypothetical protein